MAKKTAKGKAPKAAKPQPTPKAESAALVPGTVLRKPDRKGKTRCECTVEAEGYRYKGTVYGRPLGRRHCGRERPGPLRHELQRLRVLGLTKPGRATALDRLEHLWNRYSSAALAMLKSAEKAAAFERVKQHQAQMKAVPG